MNSNDKNLKEMWAKAETFMGTSDYESKTIEQFISKRSTTTADSIKKMIFLDIALKSLGVIVLGIDIFLYYGTTNVTSVCVTGIALLIILLLFQFKYCFRNYWCKY